MRSWVAVAVCTSLTGCVIKGHDTTGSYGEPDGQVQVDWRVGSGGCEASAVTTVEVAIGTTVDRFPCADDQATITVPAGSYDVILRGLDVDGMPRYGGDGGTVSVRGGDTASVPTVVLSALPATVTTTWYFENAHLCAANGVQDVEVDLFDADDTLQASITTPCDDGTVTLEDVQAGSYALLLLGRDVGGTEIYQGTSQLTVDRGDAVDIDVMLVAE